MKKTHSIRNFCIIAHVDHGKSTLADRFIERVKLVPQRNFRNQMLDSMDIEQERGITIKSQTVSLEYHARDGKTYELNLIDTPGHVDFSYEVRRAIAASEGAVLLVDAAQGMQAQTISNYYLALERDLHVIPVLNKIDLPAADIETVTGQLTHYFGFSEDEILQVSAKNGIGVENVIEQIIQRIAAPEGNPQDPLRVFVVDSHYDLYRGVILHVRIYGGILQAGMQVMMHSNRAIYKIEEVGKFKIQLMPCEALHAGEFGYICAGIKKIADVSVGDTLFSVTNKDNVEPIRGIGIIKSTVFSSIYPSDSDEYGELTTAIEKLQLNDGSLQFRKDFAAAFGPGFRCGFLGLLHLEVVQERLEREFDLNVVFTAPSVRYKLELKDKQTVFIDTPQEYPDPVRIEKSFEPYIRTTIIVPQDYLGNILQLCAERRGTQRSLNFLDAHRVELIYEIPLVEILYDFYDQLKSRSRGYASMDYEIIDYRQVELVRLDILINHEPVEALSMLVWRGSAERRARELCKSLQVLIPRHQFAIPIQGAIGGTIIARETIKAFRKDVTEKLYGGDVTRKKKLLEKQKRGKKRLKRIGNVEIPQKAFLAVLRTYHEE